MPFHLVRILLLCEKSVDISFVISGSDHRIFEDESLQIALAAFFRFQLQLIRNPLHLFQGQFLKLFYLCFSFLLTKIQELILASKQISEHSITKKRFFFLSKLLFSVLICTVVFYQVKNSFSSLVVQHIIRFSINKQPFFLLIMVLVSLLNWVLESLKWFFVLPVSNRITFMQSFRSVLIGLGMSLFVPRLAGESLGRYTSHQGDKKDVVSGLVVTKIVQTIVTFLFGCIGVLYYQKNLAFLFVLPNYWFLFLILLLITSFLLLRKKIIMLIQDSPYLYSIRQLSLTKTRNLFFVSIFRYLTFYIQFGLACLLIGVELDVYEGFFALAILFLASLIKITSF